MQVQGIGPTFKLTVNLQNTSLSMPIMEVFIVFEYDDKLYRIQKTLIQVGSVWNRARIVLKILMCIC